MPLFKGKRHTEGLNHAPAAANACSPLASEIRTLAAQIRGLAAQVNQLQRDFRTLNEIRIALEAKTWMAWVRRRAGRVAGGVARAATGIRDARGRYLPN